jgi:exopolysaccharide production protein ExoQ
MTTAALNITRSDTRTQTFMVLPAVVGFYFNARGCINYLFFTSDPRTGGGVISGLTLLLFLVVAFYSFGPAPSPRLSNFRVPCFRWVAAYLALSLCSLAWSVTISVPVAFVYWCCMAADLGMVVLLLRTGPVATMSSSIMKGYVCGACLIACVIWLSPTMEDLRPGNDDFFSPNATGMICALGVFIAQFLHRSEGKWKLPAAFLAITLLRTLSKATIIAFVLAQTFLLVRDTSISRRTKMNLALVSMLVVAAFSSLIERYYLVYTNADSQVETLTGRIGIWAVAFDQAIEKPWLGHGFHSFANVIPAFGDFQASHAHNELLQLFYLYGIAGVILLIGTYGSLLLYARKSLSPQRTLSMALVLFVAVRGLTDAERFDLSLPIWMIALISLTLASYEPAAEIALP